MARKFFYVCAGMFLLALSYHLGASTATAQAPNNSVIAAYGWRDSEPAHYAAVVGRAVYVLDAGTLYTFRATIPGTEPVVAVGGDQANTVNNVCVVLANGDAYSAGNDDASWQYDGNVIGAGPTSAVRASWGQLKSRYAPKSGPTSQTPADR